MSRASVMELAPRPALRTLCAGMMLGVLPLIGEVAMIPLLLFICVLAMRFAGWGFGGRPGVLLARVIIGAAGVGAIQLEYGALTGMAPGISVLIVLMGLKAVEARRPRDFHVLALLGFFLCLTQLFFSQTLLSALYVVLVLSLLIGALIQSESRGRLTLGRSLVEAGRLAAIAVPLVVLLFLLFPRSVGVRFQLRGGLLGQSGMSDRLTPGDIASLAQSDEIAFRAHFVDADLPSQSSLYWRGLVLWEGRGLEWRQGWQYAPDVEAPSLGGRVIRQTILLRPHGERWMFALDRPVEDVRGADMKPGNFLRADEPIYSSRRYDVVSRPENRETTLEPTVLRKAIERPERVSDAVAALAIGWRQESESDRDVVRAAMRFFRSGDFTYTLTPGTYGTGGLDEFLLRRKTGFCEHYAAAFATLMRVAGLPSRVVVGYQGGELNPAGSYVIVRQADAHAWCEVWIEGEGWERVDPTSVVAPGRLTSGLTSYLEGQAAWDDAGFLSGSSGALGMRAILRDLRLAWDNVQLQWDLHVLNYDDMTQETLLNLAGLGKVSVTRLMWLMAGILAVGTLMSAAWFWWSSRPRGDPALRAYERFCRRAASAGVVRERAEPPTAFARRLSEAFPAARADIEAFIDRYIAARYGADGEKTGPALEQAARRPRLRHQELGAGRTVAPSTHRP